MQESLDFFTKKIDEGESRFLQERLTKESLDFYNMVDARESRFLQHG